MTHFCVLLSVTLVQAILFTLQHHCQVSDAEVKNDVPSERTSVT